MRNLLLFMLAAFLSVPALAQLNCNNVTAAFSLSASGGVVTLTNSSTPTASANIMTSYTINWGDNSPLTFAGSNGNQTHTYNTSGTYTVTLYSMVTDSPSSVICYDTATNNITVTTSLNCNNVTASGYAWSNGTSWGTFVNTSLPIAGPKLSVNYSINWGDGSSPTNTTSRSNQFHNYASSGIYPVTLILTVHDSNNSITCIDSLVDSVVITGGGGSTLCNSVNAAFNKSLSGTTVTTYNSSTPNPGSGISASYKFYWGDGTSTTKSNKTNTAHTYSANGTYLIKLVATYTQGATTCVDSTSDTVMVNYTPPPPPNVIAGAVVFDSSSVNPNDSIIVWLIQFDSSTNLLTAVDSVISPAYSSYYAFHNKPAGSYRTKAHLLNGQTSGTGYVPTYHDSALMWSSANVIVHAGGLTPNIFIYLKTGTVTGGPGFVGGNVSAGANKGTASGIEGMNILLLDGNNQPVAYAVTDANGDYSFPNIPLGTYKVHPEDMNYSTTPAGFTLTLLQLSYTGVNFERSLSQKTIVPVPGSVGDINNNLAFSVHPNPATSVLNINWNRPAAHTASVNITDISGKVVYSSELQMNVNATLDISNIRPGFYFLNVETELGSYTQKLLIQQ